MKKKLILATVIVLLLAIGLTLLVGCDEIFTRNDERDMTQVVARVHYNGETSEIYKFELRSSFASYAYYYVNYYGMSAQEAAKYVLQSLAQQRLLTLYAREQVYLLDHNTDKVPEGGVPKTPDLLSASERNKAVEDANESLLSSLKTLITNAITEDNYNNDTDSTTPAEDEEEDNDVKEPVIVRFDTDGGTEIERQRIQKGTKAKQPDDPTKDGYTFYGWYSNKDFEGEEFSFDTAINNATTLYAKWEKYTAPRTAIPEEEEEDEDADYDPDSDEVASPAYKFFSDEYYATLYDELKEEDFVENIQLEEGEQLETVLKKYIDDALSDLKKNLQSNIYKKSVDECYDYYLESQYNSLIIDRLERKLGETVEVTEDEIQAEFDRVVKQNKENFELSDSAYSSALGSSLDSTYYHTLKEYDDGTYGSYGFVTNILLRLDEDSLAKLTSRLTANPANKQAVRVLRNIYLSELKVKVSNPNYDADATVEKDGEEVELRDPMTDPNNPYGYIGVTGEYDHSYQHKVSGEGDDAVYKNDYDQILSFGQKLDEEGNPIADEYEIKVNATEHPAMAYLLEEVPAFDYDDEGTTRPGIIHQIYNSFKQVEDAGLEKRTEIYWLRQLATKWAYIVGDDTGAVTSSSNNNGLGYLISPEGETSNYLEDFTSYARQLIKKGTGSYYNGEVTDDCFKGAEEGSDGTLAGNNIAFVVADSFIESGSTSNGYAGIFVLLNTYSVWDNELYQTYGDESLPEEGGELPLDFVFDFGIGKDERKSLHDLIEEDLKNTKQTNLYNLRVNTMGNERMNDIEYFEKAYKSIWKDYE